MEPLFAFQAAATYSSDGTARSQGLVLVELVETGTDPSVDEPGLQRCLLADRHLVVLEPLAAVRSARAAGERLSHQPFSRTFAALIARARPAVQLEVIPAR